LGNSRSTRYHKIVHHPQAIGAILLAVGVRALPRDTTEGVLGFDANDDLSMAVRKADFSTATPTGIASCHSSAQGDNPRFVVTNLPAEGFAGSPPESAGRLEAAPLYEDFYSGRGEMKNHLQQMQLDLQATRMSTHGMACNQLRLWLTAFGYLLQSIFASCHARLLSLTTATG